MLRETQLCRHWRAFPKGTLAIAANGAGDHLVLLRHGDHFGPAVHAWSHEAGTLQQVASDFSDLRAP